MGKRERTEECNKRFMRSDHLAKHVKTHESKQKSSKELERTDSDQMSEPSVSSSSRATSPEIPEYFFSGNQSDLNNNHRTVDCETDPEDEDIDVDD